MNDTALAVSDRNPLTARDIRAQVNLIQEVMQAVMKPDVHFGVIPGTKKPTLLKAGAEKILSTFRIGVEPQVQDLSTNDEARFRVVARGFNIGSGALVGCGVGEASSSEEKYCWREVVCDEEWDATTEDRRRMKWKRGREGKAYSTRQVRTNVADVANTVLKMAKKRAQIDLCLTATAASDVFSQDLEDLPPEVAVNVAEDSRPSVEAPRPAATEGNKISEAQAKRFYAIAKNAKKEDAVIKAYLLDTHGINTTRDITRDIYEQVCEWAAK